MGVGTAEVSLVPISLPSATSGTLTKGPRALQVHGESQPPLLQEDAAGTGQLSLMATQHPRPPLQYRVHGPQYGFSLVVWGEEALSPVCVPQCSETPLSCYQKASEYICTQKEALLTPEASNRTGPAFWQSRAVTMSSEKPASRLSQQPAMIASRQGCSRDD